MSGYFVALEGIEGSGKSTLANFLHNELVRLGIPSLSTFEPGGTDIGQSIRNILLDPENGSMSREAELFLFLADRAQHVKEVIPPALIRGEVVICDRYCDSTFAYQVSGRGLDSTQIGQFNHYACFQTYPDLVILLTLPVEIGLARRRNEDNGNRIDQESVRFHEMVSFRYTTMAFQDSERWVIIDANRPLEDVQRDVLGEVLSKAESQLDLKKEG